MSNATLKQVAERAGTSVQTVSRVLNGRNKETWPSMAARAERIRRIAQELDYRPNAAARAVPTGRTGTIALLLASDRRLSHLPPQLFSGIERASAERDLRLMVATLSDAHLTDEHKMPRLLRELSCDGLLINYHARIPQRLIELVRRHRLPAVWINSRHEADCVYPDEFEAGHRLTRYLLKQGHRRVAYVDLSHGPSELETAAFSVRDRQRGYEQAMAEAGLATQVVRGPERVPRRGRGGYLEQWLAQHEPPTAAVSYGSASALPLLVAARDRGLRVPEDLAITTFGDELCDVAGRNLPTMVVPGSVLGQEAVRMLARKVDRPQARLEPRTLSCDLREMPPSLDDPVNVDAMEEAMPLDGSPGQMDFSDRVSQ